MCITLLPELGEDWIFLSRKKSKSSYMYINQHMKLKLTVNEIWSFTILFDNMEFQN